MKIKTKLSKRIKTAARGRVQPPLVIPLRRIKRWPTLKRHLAGKRVKIYSREWALWWRENAAGYTHVPMEAGVYEFEDALARSQHCGPEKGIEYEEVLGA